MTNPGNIVRIRSRIGGRASVYEANMWAQGRTKGLMSGSGVVQNSTPNMSVLVGGSSTNPDVVIAENPAGYKIALDLIGQQSLTVTAPASNSRITSIVAYTDDLSVASTQTAVTGSPASCGLIVVNGTTSATPTAPTDAAIRSAITGDGAAGSQASYAVIAEIPVESTTTSLTNPLIANKRSLLNTLATGDSFVIPNTGIVAVSSGLTCTISDITYYISGIRYTKTGIPNKTFTASKDTYCFIDTAGTITYTEVANGADAPTLPSNSILFAWVEAGASSISAIHLRGRTTEKVGLVKSLDTGTTTQGAQANGGWWGLTTFKANLVAGYKYKLNFNVPNVGHERNGQTTIYMHIREGNDSSTIIARGAAYLPGDGSYREGQLTGFGYYNAASTGTKTFRITMGANPTSGYNIFFSAAGVVSVECVGLTSESA